VPAARSTDCRRLRNEPEASRAIKVEQFVPPKEIPPEYYDRPYYLGPDGDAEKYFALAEALKNQEKEAVVRWVMRKQLYVGANLGGHIEHDPSAIHRAQLGAPSAAHCPDASSATTSSSRRCCALDHRRPTAMISSRSDPAAGAPVNSCIDVTDTRPSVRANRTFGAVPVRWSAVSAGPTSWSRTVPAGWDHGAQWHASAGASPDARDRTTRRTERLRRPDRLPP